MEQNLSFEVTNLERVQLPTDLIRLQKLRLDLNNVSEKTVETNHAAED